MFSRPKQSGLFQPPMKSHPVPLKPMWDNELKTFEDEKHLYSPDKEEFSAKLPYGSPSAMMKKGGMAKKKQFQAN